MALWTKALSTAKNPVGQHLSEAWTVALPEEWQRWQGTSILCEQVRAKPGEVRVVWMNLATLADSDHLLSEYLCLYLDFYHFGPRGKQHPLVIMEANSDTPSCRENVDMGPRLH